MTLTLTVAVLCGAIIPAVVDVVTKSAAPDALKSGLAMVLSAISGAISTVTITPGESWTAYVLAVAAAAGATEAAHTTGYTRPIERATAQFGVTTVRRRRRNRKAA